MNPQSSERSRARPAAPQFPSVSQSNDVAPPASISLAGAWLLTLATFLVLYLSAQIAEYLFLYPLRNVIPEGILGFGRGLLLPAMPSIAALLLAAATLGIAAIVLSRWQLAAAASLLGPAALLTWFNTSDGPVGVSVLVIGTILSFAWGSFAAHALNILWRRRQSTSVAQWIAAPLIIVAIAALVASLAADLSTSFTSIFTTFCILVIGWTSVAGIVHFVALKVLGRRAPASSRMTQPAVMQLGNLALEAFDHAGVVLKVEQWSETHVSGYVSSPTVYSVGGSIHSSGGGGSISSEVVNWSRLYVDMGTDRESVFQVPGSFSVREGHQVIFRYIWDGQKSHLIKAFNPATGGWYKTGYDGRDIFGNGTARRIGFSLGVILPLAWLVLTIITGTRDIPGAAVGAVIGSVAIIVATAFLTRDFARRRKAVRNYIRYVDQSSQGDQLS